MLVARNRESFKNNIYGVAGVMVLTGIKDRDLRHVGRSVGTPGRKKSHVVGRRTVLIWASRYSSFQPSLWPDYLLPLSPLPLNLIEPLCGMWLVTQARRAGL